MRRRTVAQRRRLAVDITAIRYALVHASQIDDEPVVESLHYDVFKSAYVRLPWPREFWMHGYVRAQAMRLDRRLFGSGVSR